MKAILLSHSSCRCVIAPRFMSRDVCSPSAGPGGVPDRAHDNARLGLEACFDPTSQREEEAASWYDTPASDFFPSLSFVLASPRVTTPLILVSANYLAVLMQKQLNAIFQTKTKLSIVTADH